MEEKSIHENHRTRVYARVQKTGFDGMAEHEVLEYLLFFAIPRRDTNKLAHLLIARFGSFCGVLEAEEKELCTVEGIGPAAARVLHAVLPLNRYYAERHKQERLPMNDPKNSIQYVTPLFYGLRNERMYLIALDDKFYPVRDILLGEGQPNEVSVSMSKVAREAVASGCTGAILVHNHPNGIAVPSQEDLLCTGRVCKTLGTLGIALLDHIIVAPEGSLSFSKSGRMPYYDPIRGTVEYAR